VQGKKKKLRVRLAETVAARAVLPSEHKRIGAPAGEPSLASRTVNGARSSERARARAPDAVAERFSQGKSLLCSLRLRTWHRRF